MTNDLAALAAMPPQPLAQYVLRETFAAAGETTHLQVYRRVAQALARDAQQQERFLQVQRAGFLAGGRILAAAGVERVPTMIDSFVQPIADSLNGKVDGLPGIMPALAQAADTLRRGGGVGCDFSRLRPRGATVAASDAQAAGPVAYMRLFDSACEAIGCTGGRRAAQAAVLRVDHPDIEEFIDCMAASELQSPGVDACENERRRPWGCDAAAFGRAAHKAPVPVRNFGMCVGVSDEFMNAVVNDRLFKLVHVAAPAVDAPSIRCSDGTTRYVYRTVPARELWNRILRGVRETGDASILYLDTINQANNLRYCEELAACDPCSEQVLPPWGAGCPGWVNLTRLVARPFGQDARFDFEALARVAAGAVELLDRVLDATKWPLPVQAAEAAAKRRVGLGVLGLADAMAMLGLRYGAPESARFAAQVLRTLRDAAYRASVQLAVKLGAFPMFDPTSYLKPGTFASTLPSDIQDGIRRSGIRNSHLLSIAPSGTIALAFGDNASPGVDPIAALTASRTIPAGRSEDRRTLQADDHALRVLKLLHGAEAKWPQLVTTRDLTPEDHLAVLAAVAPCVDGTIGMTVEVPRNDTFEALANVFARAWKLGLKGCAVRDRRLAASLKARTTR